MEQLNLFVDGMGCRDCVRQVTALLRDVEGVMTVSADPAHCVIHLNGTMQATAVIAAFNGSSFTPSLLPPTTEPDSPESGSAGATE